jgi:hypothetical protein
MEFRTHVPAARERELRALVEGHTILEHVVRWALRQDPPVLPEIVHQDEFTLDICFALPDVTLVYDTT